MANIQTVATTQSVDGFLDAAAGPTRRADCDRLVSIMSEVTGEPAVMWGPAIVGFGSYHYVYESGRSGDAPLTGFSPRKKELSLYIMGAVQDQPELLSRLGKFKHAKSCIYVRQLSDINEGVLRELVEKSVAMMRKKYPVRG
jgi:hypothetical protein